jgi:DnaK suppressor protein
MNTYDDSMAARFRDKLQQRGQQLRALLQEPADPEAGRDVEDFKDIATRESLDAVDEVQADHARHELQEVAAALARLDSHGYGQCLECGADIDLLRLEALPATPTCVACQTRRELEQAARR